MMINVIAIMIVSLKTVMIISVFRNSIAGSAVCVYNMTAFRTSFEGPFKYQENPRAAWMRHDNSNPLSKVCLFR